MAILNTFIPNMFKQGETQDESGSVDRRSVLGVVAGSISLSGCLFGDGESTEAATTTQAPPQTATPTVRPSLTRTDRPTETGTDSPTATTTPTSVETPNFNQTRYPVGFPWAPFGGTYLENPVCLSDAVQRDSRFWFLDSRSLWEELSAGSPDVRGYPFVVNTDFTARSLIVFENHMTWGHYLTVNEISGLGRGDIYIEVEQTGEAVANGVACFLTFFRVPVQLSAVDTVQIDLVVGNENRITHKKEY